MDDRLERNKKTVIDFYDLMFNQCKPAEAIQKYAGNVYIQHNPHVADGQEPFISYFNRMAKEYPGKRVHFKRAFAEGNYVILHYHQEWPGYKDRHWAGIDIFRLDDDGTIVEHWDVLQVVPETSANSNTIQAMRALSPNPAPDRTARRLGWRGPDLAARVLPSCHLRLWTKPLPYRWPTSRCSGPTGRYFGHRTRAVDCWAAAWR